MSWMRSGTYLSQFLRIFPTYSSQSSDATFFCQFIFKILTFYLEQLLRNLLQKITVLTASRKRKGKKYQKKNYDKDSSLSHDTTFVVILYIEYKLSISFICGDIFHEKCGEKEKRTNT